MRKKFVALNVLGHGDDKMIQVDRVSRNTAIAKDVSFQFAHLMNLPPPMF